MTISRAGELIPVPVDDLELAVSLDEVKASLRVDFGTDDTLIGGYLQSAIEQLDGPSGRLGRCLVDQDFVWRLRAFPAPCYVDGFLRPGAIDLPLCGVSDVAQVEYVDTEGQAQVLDVSVYQLVTDNRFIARVELKPYQVWPSVTCGAGAVQVTFTSGYGAAADVPAKLKSAIMLLTKDLYDDQVGRNEDRVESLIRLERRPVL